MFFKNLIFYTIKDNSSIKQITNELLQQIAFVPCNPTDSTRSGFTSPTDNDNLMLAVGDHSLITVQTESKILPADVVKKAVRNKTIELEAKLLRKLNKSEKLSLKDEVLIDLLPKAFSKYQQTHIWINHRDNLIAVSSSSFKRAEDVLALLRRELGSLSLVPLYPERPIAPVLTNWLRDDSPADNFTILNDALLADPVDAGTIKLSKEDLTSDEIKNYINAGREVDSLSLTYKAQTTFTVNTNFVLSKIKFSSEILDKNEDFAPDEKEHKLEADFLLVAEELSSLINDFMKGFE